MKQLPERRCIVPTLPLGSHTRAGAATVAVLTPAGVADLVADLLERLELRDVTVVAGRHGWRDRAVAGDAAARTRRAARC